MFANECLTFIKLQINDTNRSSTVELICERKTHQIPLVSSFLNRPVDQIALIFSIPNSNYTTDARSVQSEFTPQVSQTLAGPHSKGRDITRTFSLCLLPNSHILYLYRCYKTATIVCTVAVYLTLGMFTNQKPWIICIMAVVLYFKLLYLHLAWQWRWRFIDSKVELVGSVLLHTVGLTQVDWEVSTTTPKESVAWNLFKAGQFDQN